MMIDVFFSFGDTGILGLGFSAQLVEQWTTKSCVLFLPRSEIFPSHFLTRANAPWKILGFTLTL